MIRRQRIHKRKALRTENFVDRYNLNKYEARQRNFRFLSFPGKYFETVNTYIVPKLKKFVRERFGDNDNLICTGDIHFNNGRWLTNEIDRCLNRCCVFFMVVTKHFIRSEYKVIIAKHKDKCKILLVNEEVYQQKIPSALKGILKVCTIWRTIFKMLEASAKFRTKKRNVYNFLLNDFLSILVSDIRNQTLFADMIF
ncbi:hypothetical protein CHS0354_023130 [Potamilus streckersoni]|uniref:TIR domain-containing protein n=1 Tax=Potamilus streckersoni TaxID=2493646 RepID=A0AAE0RN96_9BIVA|nr:hypothetical protein CHS0354_023130 [Potamilus streckersoni]